MLSAYITHPDCAHHDMGAGHPECPERSSSIHDRLLIAGLLDYMAPYDAPLATRTQLARAHTMSYVRELIAAAPTEGHRFVDPDTLMNPHTVQAALRAAGAAVLATDLVLAGKASTASCNVRPPGHHAVREAAMGFCFFNNVALGIRHALDVHGLRRAGTLYSWGLRHLVFVAPTFAAIVHPAAGPVAALGVVAVLVGFDRFADGNAGT